MKTITAIIAAGLVSGSFLGATAQEASAAAYKHRDLRCTTSNGNYGGSEVTRNTSGSTTLRLSSGTGRGEARLTVVGVTYWSNSFTGVYTHSTSSSTYTIRDGQSITGYYNDGRGAACSYNVAF